MNTIIKQVVLLAVLMSLAATGFSDTLVLKSGETITGYYEGGTARVIRFRTEDGLKEYDLLSVTLIQFGDEPVSVAGEPKEPEPVTPKPVTMDEPAVRLRTRAEGPVVPRSTSAAEGAYTVPTGSVLLVRMIDSIDSEVDRVGQTFTATLADPLVVEGVEVAARGSDLRGRITEVEGAGRVRGSAELRLELTQIVVNGIPYALTTARVSGGWRGPRWRDRQPHGQGGRSRSLDRLDRRRRERRGHRRRSRRGRSRSGPGDDEGRPALHSCRDAAGVHDPRTVGDCRKVAVSQ